MRRLIAAAVVVGLVCWFAAVSGGADVLDVVPESSLAAVMVRSADGAEVRVREVAGKLFGELPKESIVEQLLQQLKLRPTAPGNENFDPEAAARVSTIDRKGPMALVLVTPAVDIPGNPVGVVVKVGDYKKLLQELAGAVAAAAPEVTPDGTDVLKGDKGVVFAASLGQYAVVADAEYVVKTFKADVEKNLSVSAIAGIRPAYERSDLALYLNMNDIMKFAAPHIDAFKRNLQEQMKEHPRQAPMMMDPAKTAKVLGAEIDVVAGFYSQLDAVSIGLDFRADGVKAAGAYQPLPDTTLSRVAARFKPADLKLLASLDGPCVSAAGWEIDAAVVDEMTRVLNDFMTKSGLMEDEGKLKRYMESSKKMLEATGGQGALLWAPPGDDKTGLMRLVYVFSLKPNVNIRQLIKENLESSADFMTAFQGPLKVETRLDEAVESYRNCTVDKVTFTFKSTAPEDDPQGRQVLEMIRMFYGPEMLGYLTQAGDRLVYSIGYPTSEALRLQVDKVLDGKGGNLTQSPAYLSAVSGLPSARAGVMMFSVSSMMNSFMGRMMQRMAPEGGLRRVGDVKFEKPSGVAVSFGPAEKGFAVDLFIPMEEMLNIRQFIREMSPKGEPQPGPGPQAASPQSRRG